MSAAELRKAAATLRQRAAAATPGPWRVCAEGSEGSRIGPDSADKRERTRFIGILNGRVQPEDGRNAAYIATVSPDVGLALADWLDLTARRLDEGLGYPGDFEKPLTVARLINGGAA